MSTEGIKVSIDFDKDYVDLTDKLIQLHKSISKRGIGRICNDLLPEELAMLTHKEWVIFAEAYHEWNADLEDFDPKHPVMFDFMAVWFINHLLYSQAKPILIRRVR